MLHFVHIYMGLYQLITSIIHRIHGTLILTLFVLNIKEKPKVDALSPSRPWNNVPLSTRKLDSVACFKHNIWCKIFRDQELFTSFSCVFSKVLYDHFKIV